MAGAEHFGCQPRSLFLASQSVGTAARAPETAGSFDRVYAFEPVPAELEPQYARHVLGAQAHARQVRPPASPGAYDVVAVSRALPRG